MMNETQAGSGLGDVRQLTLVEMNQLLSDAADVHAVELLPDSTGTVLHLEAGGSPVAITFAAKGPELSERDYVLLKSLKPQRLQVQRLERASIGAEVKKLEELGLPLYWNRDWLVQKLDETGSYPGVARRYRREVQGASGQVIAVFARKNFGLRSQRKRTAEKRDEFIAAYGNRPAGTTLSELAERFDVPVGTVSRWAQSVNEALKQLTDSPQRFAAAEERKRLAEKHRLRPEIVEQWYVLQELNLGVPVGEGQPKNHYYSQEEYTRLQQEFSELFEQSGRRINQSRVARELGVDRSTIREWMKRHLGGGEGGRVE